ncbi:MAG: heme-dependent oxidative N-demethylase subunit alpha family protein [Bdellovibrionales bacterium]
MTPQRWIHSLVVVGIGLIALNAGAVQTAVRCDRLLDSPGRVVIESTDMAYLRDEARFAEGPAPQKNMGTVEIVEQFHFNDQSAQALHLKGELIKRYAPNVVQIKKGHARHVLSAAREQFEFLLSELPQSQPEHFRREGHLLHNLLNNVTVSLADFEPGVPARHALAQLALLVAEDLIFMKQDSKSGEFQIIGGALAYPTYWSLDYFLGHSIASIHKNISSTPEKSVQFAQMINRILARNLENPTVVRRNNWFIQWDARYSLPDPVFASQAQEPYPYPQRIDRRNYLDRLFLRVERQTLRGLPQSKVVVFAILPFVYSINRVTSDPVAAANLRDGLRVKTMPRPRSENEHHVRTLYKYLSQDFPVLAEQASPASTAIQP